MIPQSETVTVVIPTRHRPDMVCRAVDSALSQTYPALEVIVIIDGPDSATVAALARYHDPRLKVIELEHNRGAAGARNHGIEQASGQWIAFLDDDDEWMPSKVSEQMAMRPPDVPLPIMSCICRVVTSRGDFDWPRRMAGPGDKINDYLFVRKGLFKGETFAPTTTLLAPKSLLLRQPIPVSIFDDWEWLLRCGAISGTALVTVPKVLAVHYTESNRVTLSTNSNIDSVLEWAEANRQLLSPSSYAGFLLQTVGGEPAAKKSTIRGRLLMSALKYGRPSVVGLATFASHWLLPIGLRRRVRRAFYSESSAM